MGYYFSGRLDLLRDDQVVSKQGDQISNPPDQFPLPFEPIAEAVRLWRYLSLAKFLDLVEFQRLTFVRLDKLGDTHEGTLSKATRQALWARRRPPALHIGALNDDSFLLGPNDPLSDTARARVFANCWSASNHESNALWQQYVPTGEGVAISTRAGQMATAMPADVKMARVQYLDFESDSEPLMSVVPYLFKRRQFEYEGEVRCFIDSFLSPECVEQRALKLDWKKYQPDTVFHPVDLVSFIETIVVSPYAAKWLLPLVSRVAQRHGLGDRVKESEMLAGPYFDNIRQ